MVDYVREMAWMNPIYTGLRQSIAEAIATEGTTPDLGLLQLNLERARALPAREDPYILVDAAAAQLTVFDGGEAQETMRVVVGAPEDATPMMVGMLRYATLNPYWHVPPDLTRERIAPRVIDEGMSYFRGRGYEVVDDWVSGQVIDPTTIDWQAVADGSIELFIRQKPGPRNGMGKVKFQFPNNLGIYLHDTPAKHLFELDDRSASAGCVRLEDADALAAILFGEQPVPQSDEPEQTLHLPEPVPVYITYLTAVPENGRIVRREDIYGWDDEESASVAAIPKQGEEAL
jgi:murein L,D-transpeptidase YcbB/YkuD